MMEWLGLCLGLVYSPVIPARDEVPRTSIPYVEFQDAMQESAGAAILTGSQCNLLSDAELLRTGSLDLGLRLKQRLDEGAQRVIVRSGVGRESEAGGIEIECIELRESSAE